MEVAKQESCQLDLAEQLLQLDSIHRGSNPSRRPLYDRLEPVVVLPNEVLQVPRGPEVSQASQQQVLQLQVPRGPEVSQASQQQVPRNQCQKRNLKQKKIDL